MNIYARPLRCMLFAVVGICTPATAQTVLFDFDNAPIHTSLPIDQTVGGVTAHLSATGQGFSIQPANTLGFTPVGFSGLCIYPNSIYSADLIVSFSLALTDFSILYSPQELGCDDSATMRVTAYLDSAYVGTNTATASQPGTWPSETLGFHSLQVFNRVVVHYDARPPTCQDYGTIFLADNMSVTATCAAVSVTGQPSAAATCPGGSASFTVAATGTPTIGYRWQRETAPGSNSYVDLNDGTTVVWDGNVAGVGGMVSGATTATLTIAADMSNGRHLGGGHAIRYRCLMTNPCGSAASNPAVLAIPTFVPADVNRDMLANGADIQAFVTILIHGGAVDPAYCAADMNMDGVVTGDDVPTFVIALLTG